MHHAASSNNNIKANFSTKRITQLTFYCYICAIYLDTLLICFVNVQKVPVISGKAHIMKFHYVEKTGCLLCSLAVRIIHRLKR